VVAVAAARHAAHVNLREAGAERLVRDRRQVADVVLEALDVQLFQAFGADRLDAQRDFLQVLRALLRRDDDALQNALAVGLSRPSGLH
jgi:hypothetical protein